MKKSTKVIISLMLCVLTISLFGCGVKTPSDTVKQYLEQVKKGENGDFTNLLNNTLEKGEQNKEKSKEQNKDSKADKKISDDIKKITYTINSEKIDNDKATVNVKVNGPDLATVMGEYIQKSLVTAFSQAFSNDGKSEKDMDKLYEDILMQCLNNMKFTERTGDISLSKVDGKWKINSDGNLTKLLVNIDDSFFNSEKKENKKSK